MKQCELIKNESLSFTFAARENWPKCTNFCENSIFISCWAHDPTDALNEKARIKSEVVFQTLLSVANTTACYNGSDCVTFEYDVGQVATPCDRFKNTGVLSGGPYGQDDFYFDYTMPIYAHHHIEFTTLIPCDQLKTVATFFGNSCPSNTFTDHASEKVESISSYGVGQTRCDAIKKEIFTYCSVIADFNIYEHFLTYGSGVYRHLTGTAEGHHAIKCIGWGV